MAVQGFHGTPRGRTGLLVCSRALEVASGGSFRIGFRGGYWGDALEGCPHDLSGEFSFRGPVRRLPQPGGLSLDRSTAHRQLGGSTGSGGS